MSSPSAPSPGVARVSDRLPLIVRNAGRVTRLDDPGSDGLLELLLEPGRLLPERRRRTIDVHDAAGMLRSFAYAAEPASHLDGVTVAGLEQPLEAS